MVQFMNKKLLMYILLSISLILLSTFFFNLFFMVNSGLKVLLQTSVASALGLLLLALVLVGIILLVYSLVELLRERVGNKQ
jgi:hypothetical protein